MSRERHISKEDYEYIKSVSKGRCSYCGVPCDGIDHFLPLSKGGTDKRDNLIWCCKECNGRANSHVFTTPEEKKIFILARYITHPTGGFIDRTERAARAKRRLRTIANKKKLEGNRSSFIAIECLINIPIRL